MKQLFKKKIVRLICAIIAVCVAAIIVFTAVSKVASGTYWSREYSGITLDTEKYALEAEALYEEYAAQDDSMLSIVTYAEDLPSDLDEVIARYNGYIEKYFSDVYGIDVSDLIDEVEVKSLDFSLGDNELNAGGSISAMAVNDTGTLYLNSEDAEWGVVEENTYIHEVIHLLGVAESEENEMVWLYEGFTEYLTGEVIQYTTGDYVNMTYYVENTAIAAQIAAADESVITEMIGHYGEFDLAGWIDERTGGYAQELENMLMLSVYGGYGNKDILLRAQYIAAQYCKNVNAEDARQIVKDNVIVKNFELRCLIKGYK